MIELTRITTKVPDRLSKCFRLKEDGSMDQLPGGQLVEGYVERLRLRDISALAEILKEMTPVQALCYGVSDYVKARILTQKALADAPPSTGKMPTIARTRDYFHWPSKSGIMMLDYDPGGAETPLTGDELLTILYEICPELKDAPHLLLASASSYIYKGDECLRGPRGWRVLVHVADASDVPRAGTVLYQRGWLGGHGRIEISMAGSLLERGIVDAAVWQPERLDFVAGASCHQPLEQRRPDAVIFNPKGQPLDTTEALPSLKLADLDIFNESVEIAKKAKKPAAAAVRSAWVNQNVEAKLKDVPEEARESKEKEFRELYAQAAEKLVLLADFEVKLATGKSVTVGDLLENPDLYHDKRCADPVEPENPDQRVGWINLQAARPYIYSHLHGGRRFELHRARQTIQVVAGERPRVVNEVLNLMKLYGTHYRRGAEIVRVTQDGQIIPRDVEGLLFDCDGLARLEKFDGRAKKMRQCDCPRNIATGLMARRNDPELPVLNAVTATPSMDVKTGRIIDRDGYDPGTGILFQLGDMSSWPGVPAEPTLDDALRAFKVLWYPFKKFPFVGSVDRGVFLSGLLTACVRPSLPTAPGIAIDAPTAGAGKTLLAKCLAELTGQGAPAVLPPSGDNDEFRKRLMACLRKGSAVVIFDNVTGYFDSPALCAALTAETYEDRILGVSETSVVPTKSSFVVTGNNIALRGDMCRRVLTARLDPQVEKPWKRKFDLDPAAYCRANRLQMVAAALTIIKAGMLHGKDLPDRTASFELWSDTVRKAVCFLEDWSWLMSVEVSDPVLSIEESYSQDPETSKLGALLTAWYDKYQSEPKTLAETQIDNKFTETQIDNEFRETQIHTGAELKEVMRLIAGEGYTINLLKLGQWLLKYEKRVVNGLRFEKVGERGGVSLWVVRKQSEVQL